MIRKKPFGPAEYCCDQDPFGDIDQVVDEATKGLRKLGCPGY